MRMEDELEKLLRPETLRLPPTPKVERIKVEPYEESSSSSSSDEGHGEDALWVTVVLDESTPDIQRQWESLEPIDEAIREALLTHGVRLFPYIDFLKPSEMAA